MIGLWSPVRERTKLSMVSDPLHVTTFPTTSILFATINIWRAHNNLYLQLLRLKLLCLLYFTKYRYFFHHKCDCFKRGFEVGHFLYCIISYLRTGEQFVLGGNETYDQMITTTYDNGSIERHNFYRSPNNFHITRVRRSSWIMVKLTCITQYKGYYIRILWKP